MKRFYFYSLLLIFILSNMMAFGNTNKDEKLPDFNFPKTVIKNAEAQLKEALANADGEGIVDALVRFSLAKSSLSEETFGEVTTKINEVLAKENREDYRALLLYLLSEVYDTHDDNVEADSCRALIFDNDEKLKEYKIENYPKIIKSDALGRRLCPTLRDFLRYKHFGTDYIVENLEEGEMQGFRMISRYDLDIKVTYNELKEYVEKYPKSPWINDIKNRIHSIEAQNVSVDYPQQWHSTMPVTIKLHSKNAREAEVLLYRLPKNYEEERRVEFSSLTKVMTKKVTFESDMILFKQDKEISLDPLPEGGYYVLVAVKGNVQKNEYINVWKALKIKNTATYEVEDPYAKTDSNKVITVDIKTGEFVKEEMVKQKHSFRPYRFETKGDLKIFTDLGIYRPGETLHYTLIYKEKTVEARRALAGKTFRIEFRDSQGKEISSDTLTTDRFGQIAGEFLIPTDRQNGRFSLYAQNITFGDDKQQTSTSIGVTVSEYKTPSFYIDLSENPHSFEKEKDVTLRGKALSYSGIPLAKTDVKVNITRRHLWWRLWNDVESFEPLSLSATTDEKGEFSVIIPKEQIKMEFGYFEASFIVTDEAGESQEAHTNFYVGSKRSLVYNGATDFINDKPISLPISLASSEPEEKSATFEYAIYDSKKVLMKRGTLTTDVPLLDLQDLKSGTYFLVADFELDSETDIDADVDMDGRISEEIVLYRPNDKTCPKESPLWVPSCGKWVDEKGVAHITIGTAFHSHVYYNANSRTGFVKEGWLDYQPGMHEFTIQIPEGDDQDIYVGFHVYYNCQYYGEDVNLRYEKSENKLELGLSSFRDKIVPGGRETWTFTLKDRNGKPVDGRLALEVISEAVNQIQPNTWNYQSDYLYAYGTSISIHNRDGQLSAYGYWQVKSLRGAKYELPRLNLYNRYFNWGSGFIKENAVFSIADNGALNESMMVSGYAASRAMKSAMVMDDADDFNTIYTVVDKSNMERPVAARGTEENIYNNVRASETKVALWQPNVDFGENGEVSVEFEVPSDNTTWRLNAFAFNSATESNALSRTMIAQRRVMVKPSLPRFLRSGDKTTLMANVMNSSEEDVPAKITLITFDPRTNKLIDQKSVTETIPAGGMKAVGIEAEALDNLTNLGFRVIAEEISAEGMALASDGEQQMIPVLPAVMPVVETIPFYLNPTDGDSIINISHIPDNAEITYEYCNNPVWYCISALPTIYDAEIKTATGLAHNLYAVSLAKYLAEKNPLIAEALSVPFDEDACQKVVKSLSDLQNADGGISWFDWERRESSEYVTGVVLELIGELKKIGVLGNLSGLSNLGTLTKNALKYYEKKQLESLADMKKYNKKIDYTNFESYLYLRTLYPSSEYPLSKENADLLKKTLEACEKNWREFSLPSRSYLALSLFRNGKTRTAKTVIESLRQFAMTDARRGMFWDNLQPFGFRWFNRTSLTARMLLAFSEVDNREKEIDEIRKWMLLEKQTTDWGGSSMASEATFSLISTGSQWLGSAEKEYSKTIIENREPIVVKHEPGKPAWGAVFAKFPTEITKTKAFRLDEISIKKELRKHDGGKIKNLKEIKVGDKLQVQLTVKTDRDMQYVTIRDNRASCFEPVDKKSSYRFSDSSVKNRQSIGFYNDTKDTETRLMINFLPKGEHVITYDVFVTNAGTFCTGLADVTCEYAPQFTAHTAGEIIDVK